MSIPIKSISMNFYESDFQNSLTGQISHFRVLKKKHSTRFLSWNVGIPQAVGEVFIIDHLWYDAVHDAAVVQSPGKFWRHAAQVCCEIRIESSTSNYAASRVTGFPSSGGTF